MTEEFSFLLRLGEAKPHWLKMTCMHQSIFAANWKFRGECRNVLNRVPWGGNVWKLGEAILRACEPKPRAASCESLFASLKIFPPKKIKNGQNALIWYLLHAGCFHYAKPTGKRPVEIPEENGTTIKPGQPRGMASNRNGPFHLTFERNFRNLWHNRKHEVMESFPLFFLFLPIKLIL